MMEAAPRTLVSRRRGAALIMVVVTLAFISFLLVTIARQNLAQRDYLVQREQRLQAEWLVRAGLELAASKLLADPTYSGETANLLEHAKVQIEVRSERVPADVLRITCAASVTNDGHGGVFRSVTRRVRRVIRAGAPRLEIVERESAG